MKKILLLLSLLISTPFAFGQAWSGILSPTSGAGACSLLASGVPNECAIDWSAAGSGTIPARNTVSSTVLSSACPGGASDCASVIQSALNSCVSGQAVVLGAGTFRINTTINVPSNCTLRGNGANSTILDAHGGGGTNVVTMGTGWPSLGTESGITSGGTAGSSSVTVASGSGFTVGQYALITMINDGTVATSYGGEGVCNFCDTQWFGARSTQQIVKVTAKSGNILTVSPTLYTDFSPTQTAPAWSGTFVQGRIASASGNLYVCKSTCTIAPPSANWLALINNGSATPFSMNETNAGVENLQVFANNTGYNSSFYMGGCATCWLKGVESNYTDGDFAEVEFGFRDEIRDSYFSNAFLHQSGNTDSHVVLRTGTTASKVENNIIERGHLAVTLERGGAGNVVAYNYTMGGFDSGSQNFVTGRIGFHGSNPILNLFESNVSQSIGADEVWGSTAYNTYFRNWSLGTTVVGHPTSGRSTVGTSPIYYEWASGNPSTSGWWPFQGSYAFEITNLQSYANLVGNVAGSSEQAGLFPYCDNTTGSTCTPEGMTASVGYSTTRSYDSVGYGFAFGYGEAGDTGSGTGCSGSIITPCHSTTPKNTAFMHGNYTKADNAITWSGSVTHTLPASFYLSSKPAWFGSLNYPAIGPDVTSGAADSATHADLIPAQNCYLNTMGGTLGGAGSPLSFSAATCYTSSGPVATPTFSPMAGTYTGTQSITISSITAGATICYTTNGSTPTADGAGTCTTGTTYSVPVSVPISETLKAIGSLSGSTDSAVNSAAYVINIVTPTAPAGLFAKLN